MSLLYKLVAYGYSTLSSLVCPQPLGSSQSVTILGARASELLLCVPTMRLAEFDSHCVEIKTNVCV